VKAFDADMPRGTGTMDRDEILLIGAAAAAIVLEPLLEVCFFKPRVGDCLIEIVHQDLFGQKR